MGAVGKMLRDSSIIAWRNVIKIRRVPEILVFVLISPIMFVLLFGTVFEMAIDPGGGVSYREFLIGGIFAQTVVFGSTFTGAGIAEDMEKGIMDRFRSLPMSRAAVIAGRTVSDVVYNVLSLTIMGLTGLLIGWRIRGSFGDAILGIVLLLLFAYAFSWVMAFVGVLVPSVEVINNASFIVIMPLTFVSNAFVPTEQMPSYLRGFVEWNPISTLTQAVRELFGNTGDFVPADQSWALENSVLYTFMWIVIIVAVFAPLSVWRFRRAQR